MSEAYSEQLWLNEVTSHIHTTVGEISSSAGKIESKLRLLNDFLICRFSDPAFFHKENSSGPDGN